MEQQLRFCTSADGTRIAYHTLGEGRPIVSVPPWLADGEKDMERPEARALTESLAEGHRFVWFDRRGVGASQRDVDDVSLEAQVADLIAVIDSLNLERFDLIALEDGAAVSVAYAAQHPEQVSRMVFWAPTIYGADVATTETFRSLIDLIRSNWSLARRSMAAFTFPTGPVEEQRWLSRYVREAVSAEIAAKYLELIADLDVRSAAAQVIAPVLILHRRGMRNIPLVASRGAVAAIPNARFVALEGEVGVIYLGDQAAVMEQIREFFDEGSAPEPAPAAPGAGATHTILFTDMESSTALTQRLGDAKAQDVRRTHNSIVRGALKSSGGSEIKHTGDGIMASFRTASSALDCAIAIQRGVAAHVEEHSDSPLGLYVGLNAGEPIAEEGDLFGTSINLAARICDRAESGQILASDVVRQLAAGKQFLFADIGEIELRGFEDPVRLYEVRWWEE